MDFIKSKDSWDVGLLIDEYVPLERILELYIFQSLLQLISNPPVFSKLHFQILYSIDTLDKRLVRKMCSRERIDITAKIDQN